MAEDILLSLGDLQTIFRTITAQILGIDSDNTLNNSRIRQTYPREGAPTWKITEDVCFLRIGYENDAYTKQREIQYTRKSTLIANQAIQMTNVNRVTWTCYGPNSYSDALKIFAKIFDPTLWLLPQNNLYLITDVDSPVRTPEQFMGQWWERVDFYARFNELVVVNSDVPYLLSTKIDVIDEKGDDTGVNIRYSV